ncbi:DNA polymerase alpha/epsilon subunit B-domain-containing protein [Mortierella sp. GBAus27b]|nr:DNA polymerase alpha/epsilon subunit B-domain-containing protein [Mortierella sp. GBAus27b]
MATQEKQESALLRQFGPTLSSNPEALKQCVQLLKLYDIEPETLHAKWEAYILRVNIDDEGDDESMTPARLEGFKANLRQGLEKQVQQRSHQVQSTSIKKAAIKPKYHHAGISAPMARREMDLDQSWDRIIVSNALASLPPSATQPSALSKQFAIRKNISTIEESLNKHLSLSDKQPDHASSLRHTSSVLVEVKPFRYMFEKLVEKGEALNDRIEKFAEIYRKAHPDTIFHNPAYPTQSVVTVVGRICSDANEGKANHRSLVLESSRSIGAGSRVKLDLTEVSKFSFFPGQIVVLSGINANGSVFFVTQVHELPMLPMGSSSPIDLEELQYNQMRGRPLKVIAAAGPYTLNDNLLFEPFAALMQHVNKERPDVLLLMGPFVSSQHPLIVSGNIDITPEQYFSGYILSELERYQTQHPEEMEILLVPSLQDITHETTVLPQPGWPEKGLPKNTRCLSNPAQFKINEVVFAVNTADIMMHLSGDEVAKDPVQADRMGRLAKYLIEQRSMHPVYPGLTLDVECGVDYDQSDLLDLVDCPDILILPSRLKGFVKNIDDTIVVNPNHLSKGQSAGTYARFTIHPLNENTLNDSVMLMDTECEASLTMDHRVSERCRVDLVRV